jgi:biotin transport system substrate-specific component
MDKTAVVSRRKAIGRTVLISLFAALIAAGTFISIPLPFSPVPIVLQNLFALLAGLILGPILGGLAALLYLVAGAIGAPVFAGATGGFVHFLGPTGGYLAGYFLAAVAAGLVAGIPRSSVQTPLWRIILGTVLGLLVVYVPGVIRLKAALNTGWGGALAAGFLPFLIGDGIKGAAAVLIAPRLRRAAADLSDG